MTQITWRDLPKEIQEKMLEEQFKQRGVSNEKVFEVDLTANKSEGGFNWIRTDDGNDFWWDIIYLKRFYVFYEKYPKRTVLPPLELTIQQH